MAGEVKKKTDNSGPGSIPIGPAFAVPVRFATPRQKGQKSALNGPLDLVRALVLILTSGPSTLL